MKSSFLYLFLCVAGLSVSSCYYDKEQELYPTPVSDCDTAAVSYSASVATVIQPKCLGCHSNSSSGVAGGGIALEGHTNFKAYVTANKTKFINAISHNPGASPMPKGGAKLQTCEINKINAWINQGANNN